MSYGYSLLTPKLKDRLKRVSIAYEPKKIVLGMHFYSTSDPIKIEYQEDGENKTLVICGAKSYRVTVHGSQFVDVFCEDLKAILAHRKSTLQELQVGFTGSDDLDNEVKENSLYPIGDQIFLRLEEILVPDIQVSQTRLKVKTLTLDITSIDQVLAVLPHLAPEALEKVDLTLRHESVEIEDVMEVEEWEDFEKGLEMELTFDELTTGGLMAVKEVLLQTESFKSMEIHFEKIEQDELDELFGPPAENNESAIRSRAIEASDIYLWTIQTEHSVRFSRRSIPRNPEPLPIPMGQTPEAKELSQVFENPLILMNTLKYADGLDIQSLRKVSHTIRDTVDFLTPDPKIKNISLESNGYDQVSVNYNSKTITYEDCLGDCVVGNQYIQGNHLMRFLMDFQSMLKYQRPTLKFFSLKFRDDQKFLELFSGYLRGRAHEIQIEKLKMEIVRQSEAMAVLPYVEPVTLKAIELQCPSIRSLQTLLDINEIVQLDQWKYAQEIIISSFVISTSIRQIYIDNLVKADMCFDMISTEDLHYLKEKFLTSPCLTRFKISFKEFANNNNTNDPWDVFNLDISSTSYYRIPNNTERLLMLYTFPNSVIFSHEGLMSIPDNAVFRG